MPATECFACGSRDLTPFYEQAGVPVNSCLMMPSKAEAISFPKGDIRLVYCNGCGFIQNVLFDASRLEYSPRYEETQGFSPLFNQWASEVAQRYIDQYGLRGKQILEIGCGKGEFLSLLCRLGDNTGVGIDPAYVSERQADDVAQAVRFITDFYGEQHLDIPADLIACRHTLEHISPVSDFVDLVRRSVAEKRDPIVFFEVPDVMRVLRELAFWDIYYEHCSYFSLGSLARLFRARDFDVIDLRMEYDDQYILLDAIAGQTEYGRRWEVEDDMPELSLLTEYFRDNHEAKLAEWSRSLKQVTNGGGRAVLWGSSSKAVSYLTTLETRDQIEYVVDINPYRHGKFLAGSGHEIVPPDFLKDYKPDLVIAMNPIYKPEIQEDLDRMGVRAELTAV
jgi:SAM-dependent methyltransferase